MALTLVLYSAAILLASLLGGWIPMWVKLTHRRMELAISFVAGMMLGVGVFHLLPHAFFALGSIDRAAWWMVIGLMTMFLVERFFSFHRTTVDHAASDPSTDATAHSHVHGHGVADMHAVDCAEPACDPTDASWTGAFIGLTLHTLLAGIALAASVASEAKHGAALAGFGTFLVIVLHKPIDSLTIGTLMAKGGWSKRARHWVNALFALVIPLGIAAFFLGIGALGGEGVVGAALAFSAGTFLCIALSDLLPELQFHSHDRIKLTVSLIVGLAAAWAIGFLEEGGHDHSAGGGHSHGSGQSHGAHAADPSGTGAANPATPPSDPTHTHTHQSQPGHVHDENCTHGEPAK